MEIVLEHVRSFAKKREIPLRPLTLLVGENSSGKSTFLAVAAAVLERPGFPWSPAFNSPPYSLGNFDTIATFKGGKYGRDEKFKIGIRHEVDKGRIREAIATYANEHGQVVLSEFHWTEKDITAVLSVSQTRFRVTVRQTPDRGPTDKAEFEGDLPASVSRSAIPGYAIWNQVFQASRETKDAKEFALLRRGFEVLEIGQPFGGCHSLAPIRSKPRRTYDEFSEEYSPEGDHVPTLIARLLTSTEEPSEGKHLRDALERFGQESGLFRKLDVKRLGKHLTDPFQIQVSVAGPPVNLTDVGYGVSQALPVVVQSVLRSKRSIYLLQQPEVHLHPRAQAALGTFFADLASRGDRTFVVETHSDHLVDRVRHEVAQGRITAEQVIILFFDKPKLETEVTPIELDDQGNVVDAPSSYRRFFLEEELKLFAGGTAECA
jgi:energy-coupling factor transporter ATP-binding protein EcfA2